MEAVRGLQHSHVFIQLISLGDLFSTELANAILFLLLHLFVVSFSSLSLTHVHEGHTLHSVSVEKLFLLLHDLLVVVEGVRG